MFLDIGLTCVAVALALLVAQNMWRKQSFALAVLAAFTTLSSTRLIELPSLTFGSVQAHVSDAVFVPLFIIAASNFLFLKRASGRVRPTSDLMWLLAIVLVISTIRGVGQYGLQAALNASRTPFNLLAAGLWATNTRRAWRFDDLRSIVAVGFATTALLIYGILRFGFRSASVAEEYIGGELVDPRPIYSAAAMMILLSIVIVLYSDYKRRYLQLAVLSAALLLSQQRTIWVVFVVALVVWTIQFHGTTRSKQKALFEKLSIFLAMVAFVAVIELTPVLSSAANLRSTLDWRQSNWMSALQTPDGLVDYAIGITRGQLRLSPTGGMTALSAHNQMIDGLLDWGIAGSIAYYWYVGVGVRNGFRSRTISAGMGQLIAVLILVQGYSYRTAPITYAVLGIAVSGIVVLEKSERPRNERERLMRSDGERELAAS